MSEFTPIAIIGQGCILPGAHSPTELWDLVADGRSHLTPLRRSGRDDNRHDRDKSGDNPLDELFLWGEKAAKQALTSAGYRWDKYRDRAAVIVGNKIYPTPAMIDFAAQVHRGGSALNAGRQADARNRFCAGYPAAYIAQRVGFGGLSYGLDVACASSLYAINLASRALHRRDTDLMLAGGLNGADDQFLRAGFRAVGALSPTGQSRPFHRQADGLVPASGAALLLLKRLDDALEAGDSILGVIRGIGLSNDGRSQGFLPPSAAGQTRALRAAYDQAKIDPATISLIECHAAGTARGDATEVQSLARFFKPHLRNLPIASLKSNIGHAITVSGAAGLIKILEAFRHGQRPPTLHADDPIDEIGDPLRLLQNIEAWDAKGPRRAGINNFGFGGNNAHLIVEEFYPVQSPATPPAPRSKDKFADKIAIIAAHRVDDDQLDVTRLRFPPRDLDASLRQQRLVVAAALALCDTIDDLDHAQTGAFIGMNLATEISDHCLAMRGHPIKTPTFDATRAMGCMPNLVTNRLNAQFNLTGQSLTIAAEELSGTVALELAAEALRRRDLDAAIVGAVATTDHAVHIAAQNAVKNAEKIQPNHSADDINNATDGAVILVLKRLSDCDDDDILAIYRDAPVDNSDNSAHHSAPQPLHHAASSLFALTKDLTTPNPARPKIKTIVGQSFTGNSQTTSLQIMAPKPQIPSHLPAFSKSQSFKDRRFEDQPFADEITDGELAFVFTGPAGAYRQMGRSLLASLPGLVDSLHRRCQRPDRLGHWIYADSPAPISHSQRMWGATFLSQVHAEFTGQFLGLQPDAAIGFCSGEINALFGLGAWDDLDGFYDLLARESVFESLLAGEHRALRKSWGVADDNHPWQAWRLFAPRHDVEQGVADLDHCHLIIVNAPGDLVIGGTARACATALERINPDRAHRMGYEVAMHCDGLSAIADHWRQLHHRPTHAVPDVRFYAHSTNDFYDLSAENVANALVGQALNRVDFPALIEKAYADGVRIFVEHGPRDGCSRWISKILGSRPHLATALDRRGTDSLTQAIDVARTLRLAGVDCSMDWLDRLRNSAPDPAQPASAVDILPPPPALPATTDKAAPPSTSSTASVAAAHRQFLKNRAELHGEFLSHQQRLANLLANF